MELLLQIGRSNMLHDQGEKQIYICTGSSGARGGAVGWGIALQAGKVAGSIPDGVTGFFYWHNRSGRTMVLELTQSLTEMSTRNVSWG